MRVLPIATLIVGLAATTFAGERIEPLDVKTGLWDVTFTSNVSGAPPIPADRLESMTPEQRARLEQMWKDRQAKGPQTKTKKHCVTSEDLREHAFIEEEPSCSKTVLASSGKELNVRVQCSSEEGTRTSTYHIQALSSEQVKGAVRVESSGGGRSFEVTNDFSAKWVGPVCGTTKN